MASGCGTIHPWPTRSEAESGCVEPDCLPKVDPQGSDRGRSAARCGRSGGWGKVDCRCPQSGSSGNKRHVSGSSECVTGYNRCGLGAFLFWRILFVPFDAVQGGRQYDGAPAGISFIVLLSGAALCQSGSNKFAFDIADVHVSPRSDWVKTLAMQGGFLRGDRYELRRATMLDLIRTAYNVDADKVYGGPAWLDYDRFEIVAKTRPWNPF